MKILELFSGTESFSKVARERGHQCFTIDINHEFGPDLHIDIVNLKLKMIPFKPDIVWASPPCVCFSVASISKYWRNGEPRYSKTIDAINLVKKTLELINQLNPKFWFIENPRGMLRKQDIMIGLKRTTVTYCQYGAKTMKPTDIWNNNNIWKPKPMCKKGSSCHERGSRGFNNSFSKLGSSGRIKRAVIPKELCEEIIKVCENER